jgi:hypothetical protein
VARDAELDRLKIEQDQAYQRKEHARRVQDEAWERRSDAREAMNQAYDEKQRAYEIQDAAWQEYQGMRSSNGPRIDRLNDEQEAAFQNMKRAFENASSAHDQRDGASAKMYADEGHRYKEEAQAAVAERRELVAEIRAARDRHDDTKPAFQRAKERFGEKKREYDRAKTEHERKQAELRRAQGEFEEAKSAFRERLEAVRAESQRRKDDKRSIAERAGVPREYLDDVWVSTQSDGSVNIYFGGVGAPNGPGHGHYVMDASGNVTYARDPFDPHGRHNFTDAQQDYYDVIGAEAAGSGEFGFPCRFRGFDAYVESNINMQGRPKIDIYYGPKGPFGPGHHHAVAYREAPFEFISDELRG